MLAKIVGWAELEKKNVITLAFHVDYWNRLGWRDRFSDRAFSERQRWYALHEAEPRLYTPQMIVQGTNQFVGSKENQAFEAVKAALGRSPEAEVALAATASGPSYEVTYEVRGAKTSDHVNLVLVQRRAKTTVEAGENAGATLTHVSIVRDHTEQKVEDGRGSWRVTPEAHSEHAVVAFVQNPESLEVLGVNRLKLQSPAAN